MLTARELKLILNSDAMSAMDAGFSGQDSYDGDMTSLFQLTRQLHQTEGMTESPPLRLAVDCAVSYAVDRATVGEQPTNEQARNQVTMTCILPNKVDTSKHAESITSALAGTYMQAYQFAKSTYDKQGGPPGDVEQFRAASSSAKWWFLGALAAGLGAYFWVTKYKTGSR